MRLTNVRGHYVWTAPLNSDSVVLDAGAHRGEFSSVLYRSFGCRCVLIEANPLLSEMLEQLRIGTVFNAALAGIDGRTKLHLEDNLESSSIIREHGKPMTATLDVTTVSLKTVLSRIGSDHIDLLKLDIEGAEFEVINCTPEEVWRKTAQVSVEFHEGLSDSADGQRFKEARAKLDRCGFACGIMSFRTHGDVLFVNQNLLQLSSWQILYLRVGARIVERAMTLLPR